MIIFQNIKCWIGSLNTLYFAHWHNLRIIEKFGHASSKLQCNNCKRFFAMNDDVKVILDWDNELEDLKRRLGNLWE